MTWKPMPNSLGVSPRLSDLQGILRISDRSQKTHQQQNHLGLTAQKHFGNQFFPQSLSYLLAMSSGEAYKNVESEAEHLLFPPGG